MSLAEEGALEKLFSKGAAKRKEKVNCGVAKCQKKAFKDLFCAVHYLAVERDGYLVLSFCLNFTQTPARFQVTGWW